MELEIRNSSGVYVNVTHLIAHGGVSFSSSPFTGGKSITTMDGRVYRTVVKYKDMLGVSFISLSDQQLKQIVDLTSSDFFYIRYYSPMEGRKVEKEVYVEGYGAKFSSLQSHAYDGTTTKRFTEGEGYSTSTKGYDKFGALNKEGWRNANFAITGGFTIKATAGESISNTDVNVNFLDKDKQFISNGYSGPSTLPYKMNEKSVPANAEYVNISLPYAAGKALTVLSSTRYWTGLGFTFKER